MVLPIGARILFERGVAGIFSALSDQLSLAEPDFTGWRRPAAVMVILCPVPRLSVLLIRRPETLSQHAGQIACPGGAFDARFDRNLLDTAARETWEEVGIRLSRDRWLGFLDVVHIVVTGFTLLPVVSYMPQPAVLRPEAGEVESYQWVDVAELRRTRRMGRVMARGVSYRMPEFSLGMGRLWGATARVMDQLLVKLVAAGIGGEEEVFGADSGTTPV